MKWKIGVILGLILIGVGLILFWQLAPTIEEIQSTEGPLFSRQPLLITFSRAMNPLSMESHFSLDPPIKGDLLWNDQFTQLIFTPDKAWPSGETIQVRVDSGARSRILIPLLKRSSWKIPVSPTLLVYLWPADSNSRLYQVNPENAETQELISEPGEVLDFSPAGDGMMILYSLLKENGDSALLALNRLTSESELLITCSAGLCRNPQLSPDGSLLAFEFISREPGAQPGIQILDIKNKNREDLGDPDDYIDTPQWSPSGWLSYYNHSQQLYTFWNPQADELLYLPNETGGDGSWTADGRYFVCSEILFTSETLAPRHLQLYDLSEGTSTDLSEGNLLEDLNPSFSPRGTDLAFSRKSLDPSTWSPGRQLWVMNLEDREAYPLTDEMDFHHTSFAWHPDGSQLAFVRYNQAKLSDPPEIWIINRDGSDKFRLIINGFAPAWIP